MDRPGIEPLTLDGIIGAVCAALLVTLVALLATGGL